jgi:hypothetical protein
MSYNASDWYWCVGGSTTQVFSSARQIYVPASDGVYQNWLSTGKRASQIASEAELLAVLATSAPGVVLPSAAGLVAYAQKKQAAIAAGGISVALSSSVVVEASTDAGSLALLNTAVALAQATPSATTPWVQENGTPVSLNAGEVLQIFEAAAAFIQSTFATLSAVIAAINGGTITTRNQVDTPPSPVRAWPVNS